MLKYGDFYCRIIKALWTDIETLSLKLIHFSCLNSDIQKEHTTHTTEYTLNLLECGVSSLKKEAIMNKKYLDQYIQEVEGLHSPCNQKSSHAIRDIHE
jgi:hypothetical protein